jgi:hypothetical protein
MDSLEPEELDKRLRRLENLKENLDLAGGALDEGRLTEVLHAQTTLKDVDAVLQQLEDDLMIRRGQFEYASHGVPKSTTYGDPRLQYGKKSPPEKAIVRGKMGEAEHAQEVVAQVPRLAPGRASELRAALVRGEITVADLVRQLPEEGVAQMMFPSGLGRRYIDHVYLDPTTLEVVFRESKNVEVFKLTKKHLKQLDKDISFLQDERFAGLRVEWRISGNIDAEARHYLDELTREWGGRFHYTLDTAPGT